MKNIYTIFAGLVALSLCYWVFVSMVSSSFEVPKEGITFHQLNLVCGAAPDIGCGSRSKPILLELEKEATIKEAWLNRPGTVLAIVWEEGVEPNVKAVSTIFKEHGKSFKTLKGGRYQKQFANFNSITAREGGEKWYKSADVDELSMEEAGLIATGIIDQLVEFKALTKEDAPKMHREVEAYIQNEFMILEDVSLLSTSAYYDTWEMEIRKIGKKYVDEDKMPDLEMCRPSSSSCKK